MARLRLPRPPRHPARSVRVRCGTPRRGASGLGVVVAEQEPDRQLRVVQVHRGVPGLLGDPARVGLGRDADGHHLPGAGMQEERHVQGLQPDRLHREEAARHDPLGLGFEELRPGRPAAPRRWAQPVASQQRPDGRGAHPDPELAQLPADPDAAQRGFSLALRSASATPRRPAAAGQAGAPCGRSICVARGRGASAAASGRDQEQWRPPLPGKRAACRGEQDAVEWVNWAGEPGGGVRVAVAAGPGSPGPWSPGQRLRGRAGGQARRRPTRLGTASADGTESLVTTRIRVSAPHKDEDQPLERDRDDKKSQIGLPPFIEGRP